MVEPEESISYEKQSVSFRKDQIDAIWKLAGGKKRGPHSQFSRVVQLAVDELIQRREQAEQAEQIGAAA